MTRSSGRRRALEAAAGAERVLVLLDFDGTLARAPRRPAAARLDPSRLRLLRSLGRGRCRAALVSGRGVDDLRAMVRAPAIILAGAFGLEVRAPDWRWRHPAAAAARPALAALARRLRRRLAGVPGAAVEDKGAAVCLHWGAVAAENRRALRRLLKRERRAAAALSWRVNGDSVEVSARARWDKGRAALLLWRRLGRPFLVAIGNDRFDEPMLRAAQARGAAWRVGQGPSRARLRLRGPAEAWRLLAELKRRLSQERAGD